MKYLTLYNAVAGGVLAIIYLTQGDPVWVAWLYGAIGWGCFFIDDICK